MLIQFHMFYGFLWAPLIVSLFFFKKDKDEFRKQKKIAQIYYRLFPFLCMLWVYLYAFMNAEVFTDNPYAFITRLGFLLIGCTCINVLSLLFRYNREWLIGGGITTVIIYLALMVGWNIFRHCRTLAFIINMVLAVVALFPIYLIAVALGSMAITYTKEEQAAQAQAREREKELKAQWAAERKAREEEDRKRQEAQRAREQKMVDEWAKKQAAKGKPVYQPQNRWQTPAASNWDDEEKNDRKSWSDTVMEWYEEKGSVNDISGTGSSRNCANCADFWNGECHNSASAGRNEVIWNPQHHSCGFHHY